ncbi:immunoglobulin-like domain-containing protein [Desulfitobacterium dehalogenans]|uniref:immunoglobulin-like domain-containing protein n=1 Tax=Desulfitobacterium dehalogenans TaxID=36854 RepID=UPI0011D285CB|nr:immunoglobulin-like domain-containing protein [Desulfitobacterium dehalogenans]
MVIDECTSTVNIKIPINKKASRESIDIADWKPTTYYAVNNLDGVIMTIKKGTVPTTKLTVTIVNNSNNECTYGDFFDLEKKINRIWYKVPVSIEGDYGFHLIGYGVSPGYAREWTVDWSHLYRALEAGDYRIIKGVSGTEEYTNYYLAAEFTIN